MFIALHASAMSPDLRLWSCTLRRGRQANPWSNPRSTWNRLARHHTAMLVCLCLRVLAEALRSLMSECCFMFGTQVEHMIQHHRSRNTPAAISSKYMHAMQHDLAYTIQGSFALS